MPEPTTERIAGIRRHATEVEAAHGEMSGLQLERRDLLRALDYVAARLEDIDTGDDAACECGLCAAIDYLIAYIGAGVPS